MIINEDILIKRGKIQLMGEDRKKWYRSRLHLKYDAPPVSFANYCFNRTKLYTVFLNN